ncbi:MAG TPA: hypothetical protein VN921_05295 [Chthoniobacterales bacterium]|nr:hypothetical protein [Chthoniobacterales bacterium]
MNNRFIYIAVIITSLMAAQNGRAEDLLLPNPKLTPGKIARRDKDQHGVSVAMEQKVFKRYRIPWIRRAEFKIDHLIPLELGGADHVENLWPQNLRVKPYGVERKELLTRCLLLRIAEGRITLAQAQTAIQKDWIDAFIDYLGPVYLR